MPIHSQGRGFGISIEIQKENEGIGLECGIKIIVESMLLRKFIFPETARFSLEIIQSQSFLLILL